MRIVHNVNYHDLIGLPNLLAAWDEFKKGKISKRDVMQFERNLEDNLLALHTELASLSYRHGQYTVFHIHDPKHRIISKAEVRDRLVHHLVFKKLYEIFDPTFISHCYSSRLDKGTHIAVKHLSVALRKESKNVTRPTYALKCDIKKFFQSIPHGILMQIIEARIKDQRFLWLLQEIIFSFSLDKGLPIGNLTSQIFANVFLNELDRFAKHTLKVKHYFRYADDFVVVNYDPQYLKTILFFISDFLEQKLRLSLHPHKVVIRKYTQGIDFLGYVILPKYITIRHKTKKRMLKKLTQKEQSLNQQELDPEKFYQSVQSYLGMLSHCDSHDLQNLIKNRFLSASLSKL